MQMCIGPRLILAGPKLATGNGPAGPKCILVPRVIFWFHSSVKWYKLYMSGESESEHDLLEQAYDYKVNGRYPEGCTLNKKS